MDLQDLTVSVVTYRHTLEALQPLFTSLAEVSPGNVCVVDNAGDDSLALAVRARGFRYVCPARNLGYGCGHNQAFDAMQGLGASFHLVVNPDVSWSAGVLAKLLAYLRANAGIGLIMPDVRYPDGTQQRLCKLLPTPADLFVRRFVPDCQRRKNMIARYELHDFAADRVVSVPVLSGCFMLMRADAFRQAGGFDPMFFMYLEDVDLCRRLGRIGEVVFYPAVSVVHHYAKGSYRLSKLLIYHCVSAVRYFNKWGWLFDAEREVINRTCLASLQNRSRK